MKNVIHLLSDIYNYIATGFGYWRLKLLGAFVALILGLWLVGMIMRGVSRLLENKHIDETLRPFLTTLIGFALKALLLISIAGIVGIPTASFASVIAAVAFAIGSAFKGSLSHMASGVMLLIFRFFKVGDWIKTNNAFGFVREVSVFVTVIETFQNETEIIPNSTITSNKITNLTAIGNLRVDMPFAIRYGSDIEKAKEIVLNVLNSDVHVLEGEGKAPRVAVNNLGVNSVELLAIPYVNCENYWDVFWDTKQKIVEALGNAGYEAPLPSELLP